MSAEQIPAEPEEEQGAPGMPTGRELARARNAAIPGSAQAGELEIANASPAVRSAVRLAQVVNLHIAGYSLSAIGAAIGASAEEVDRMLASDTARYVKSQPALRVYVRNWISERYMKMIDADYAIATDATHKDKLENQDRVIRILDRMSKLHGADAPTQTEVKVESAPEAVEKLVAALASAQGMGYDAEVFDVDEADDHEAVIESEQATLDAGEAVGEDQPGDEDWGTDDE